MALLKKGLQFLVLSLALFLRIYRVDELLAFHYDQGRDAKVIWDLWHNGKLFLIGPTTGIEGIFRGPWYYWLIAPWYLIGQGNPVAPAIFLACTTVLALGLFFALAKTLKLEQAGWLTLIFGGFSFYIMLASRWLSNPTPMMLISAITVLAIYWISIGKQWAWVLAWGTWGMAMQFGSATEVFMAFGLGTIYLVSRDKLPSFKLLGFSGLVVFLAFLPQIIFDFKHEHILTNNLYKFIFNEKAFYGATANSIFERFELFKNVFSSKLFPSNANLQVLAWWFFLSTTLVLFFTRSKDKFYRALSILVFSPMFGMLFFTGNNGTVYDYYFTGYYLPFLFLFSLNLSYLWKKSVGRLLVVFLVGLFLNDNISLINNYLQSKAEDINTIRLDYQLAAIKWIYADAKESDFNVDVYVPPVISHSYDYLLLWQGSTVYHKKPNTTREVMLYLIYEQDPPHPERLQAWMARQNTYSPKSNSTARFGGVSVERRIRL